MTLAGAEGRISGSGTSTSLLAKLGHADDANARRGPELHVTLYDYDRNGNRVRRTAPDETSATMRDWIKTDYTYNFENKCRPTRRVVIRRDDAHLMLQSGGPPQFLSLTLRDCLKRSLFPSRFVVERGS